MAGNIYMVDLPSTAVTTAIDLLEITPADERRVSIVAIFLFQTTELGDAAEEVLPIQIIRGFTASGSVGGTAPTVYPVKRDGPAFAGAVEVMNTTLANTGTVKTYTDGWNIRIPYVHRPASEEEEIDATQADTTIVVRLPSAPADSITLRGTVLVREV